MRWFVRFLFALITLAALGLGLLFLIPSDRIAALAAAQFSKLTGRELVISGASAPSFWPTFGVKTGPVRIANAPWSERGPMIEAEALEISVDMASLLAGDVKIEGITALRPVIRLERNADGQANWEFGGTAGGTVSAATPGVGKGFTLDQAAIEGGTLIYSDAQGGTELELADLTGTIEIPDYEGAARAVLTGRRGPQDFAADVTIGAFRPFLDGEEVPVELALEADRASLAFTGTAAHSPARAEGQIRANLADLKALAALAGVGAPALPRGLGQREITLAGGISLAPGPDIRLKAAEVTLDGTPLSADLRLRQGSERPMISGSVTAGAFDFAAGGGGQTESGGGGAGGWSEAAIDVSALMLFDADLALKTGSIRLGGLSLDALDVALTNERGRLVADIARAGAYGGTIAGQMVVNGRKGLSTSADLAITGMALQPFLTDLMGYDRLKGTGDIRLNYLASGGSVAALMRSIEGSGSLSVGQGELIGADLTAMLLTLDASQVGQGQKTIFDSLTASFTIAGGVLHNEDLLLVSPRVTAKGKGEVDLGGRTLDYRLRATALGDAEGRGGLSAPLVIYGSWDKPRFTIDLEALAEEDLKDDLGTFEDRAKADLTEQLGIEPLPGESLEDATRRTLEEQIQEELLNLLGGN